MATIYTSHQEWHAGELSMKNIMSAPTDANPTSTFLTPSAADKMMNSPLLAIGALDSKNRPWTSLWGGVKGFSRPLRVQKGEGESVVAAGVRCLVDGTHDPVLKILEGRDAAKVEGDAETSQKPKDVSGLSISLVDRKRAKWTGSVMGLHSQWIDLDGGDEKAAKDVQMIAQVTSSLGNCPKYLNRKVIQPTVPKPELIASDATSPTLPQEAIDLVSSADCLFLTSSNAGTSMSTNYRGGPKGFIRLIPAGTLIPPTTPPPDLPAVTALPTAVDFSSATNTQAPPRLIYPEYSGNRLYQTLGNLLMTPLAGLAIPDFSTGAVLYATCSAQILHGAAAGALLPRSNLAVVLTLSSWRLLRGALGFTATPLDHPDGGMSPYNPVVRYVAGEEGVPRGPASREEKGKEKVTATATLVGKTLLADDVARVAFETDRPVSWTRGQSVALSFFGELGSAWSHMRDDDPRSLNEDWVRSFTVSCAAPPGGEKARGFEVTIRNVGPCTALLVKANPRAGIEVGVLGFEGEFVVEEGRGEEKCVFVAGGIGITPLIAQVAGLRRRGVGVVLVWGVRRMDLALVKAVLGEWKEHEVDARIRVAGVAEGELSDKEKGLIEEIEALGGKVVYRRVGEEDLEIEGVSRWNVCAGLGLARAVDGWAAARGVEAVGESFAY